MILNIERITKENFFSLPSNGEEKKWRITFKDWKNCQLASSEKKYSSWFGEEKFRVSKKLYAKDFLWFLFPVNALYRELNPRTVVLNSVTCWRVTNWDHHEKRALASVGSGVWNSLVGMELFVTVTPTIFGISKTAK